MKVKTRFAPSPTGFMHIGNLRTAIFEYLVAKHDKGDFLLRIEDTDQTRKVEGAISFIYDTLNLCDIKIDEGPNNEKDNGPYIQSERKDIYLKYAKQLIESNHAYYCFCSEERLEKLRNQANERKKPFKYDGYCQKLSQKEIEEKLNNKEKYVIRQKMPKYGKSVYNDEVYGKIIVNNDVLEDQILIKSDGYPTYNFANVIDDHLMGITHVIRGNEYLSQTPKYNLLYEALGWDSPTYIHVPMVLGEDGNKLSKRNGDASFMDLYKDGYLPQAIVNYLVLLGWSSDDNQEIFTMDELIEKFTVKRISKSPSTFDIKKLQWFNAHYIKNMSDEKYMEFILPYLKNGYDISSLSEDWLTNLALIYKDHISYGKQIIDEVKMFFQDDITLNEEAKEFMKDDSINNTLTIFKDIIKDVNWSKDDIKTAINLTKEKANVKGKMLFMPIRIAVSGLMHGPELVDTIYLLGKNTVISRLESNLK